MNRTAAVLNIGLFKPHESRADSPTSTHATTRDRGRRSENKTKQASIDQVEAQLWQLEQFLRGERNRQPDTQGVLHAERTKRGIQLYVRPKANGFFCVLFDSIKNGEKQKLAAETLAVLVNTYKTNCAASGSSSPNFKAPCLDFLTKRAASVEVNAIALGLEEIAIAISNKYFIKGGEPAHSIQETMGHILRDALNINSGIVTSDTKNALVKLAVFGFSFAEIKSFSKLINNIIGRENAREDLRKIDEFKKHWIKKCDDSTAEGKTFRKFVIDNPEFGTWNLVAHHLSNRATKFDLRSYAGYDCVMVPQTSEMVWSEVLNDGGRAYSNVEKLHTDAAKDGNVQFMRSANSGPKLFAAESLVIDPEKTELSFAQKCHLEMAYRTVITIPVMLGDHSLFVLTPLFNYTENTIDACVSLMLRPLKQALEEGNTVLKLHLFSTDPRIVEKFNAARHAVQEGAKKKKNITDKSFSAPIQPRANPASAAITTEFATSPESSVGAISEAISAVVKNGQEAFEQVKEAGQKTFNEVKEAVQKTGEKISKPVVQQVNNLVQPKSDKPEIVDEEKDNEGSPELASAPPFDEITASTNSSAKYGEAEIANLVSRDLEEDSTGHVNSGASYPFAAVENLAYINAASTPGKRQKSKVRNPRQAEIASPVIQAPFVINEIKLQIGITESNWLPDESNVLMLTRSSSRFLQPDQTQLKQDLEKLLKSEEFGECEEDCFTFKKDGRNIVAVKELSIDTSIGLLQFGKKNNVLSEIVNAYSVICKNASIVDMKKIVLSPCFSLPDTNRIRFDHRYEDAIEMMIDTITKSIVEFPELDITLVARSEKEHAFMQKTMTDLKQKKQTAY